MSLKSVISNIYQAITGEGTISEKIYNIKVLSSGLPTIASVSKPSETSPAPVAPNNATLNKIQIIPVQFKKGDPNNDFELMIEDPVKIERSLFIYNESFTEYVGGKLYGGGGNAFLRQYRRDVPNPDISKIKALGIPTGFIGDPKITSLLPSDSNKIFVNNPLTNPTLILPKYKIESDKYSDYILKEIASNTINNQNNIDIINDIFYTALNNIYNYVNINNINTVYYSSDGLNQLAFNTFSDQYWTKINGYTLKQMVTNLVKELQNRKSYKLSKGGSSKSRKFRIIRKKLLKTRKM